MSARNVSLTDHLSQFVDEQVANGRHQNASEVVREALRRYQDDMSAQQERIEVLRTVIAEGRADLARGDYTVIETEQDRQVLLRRWTGKAKVG